MNRINDASKLLLIIAAAALSSATYAEEPARDSGAKPPKEKHPGIFDTISNLFGTAEAEREEPKQPASPNATPPANPTLIINVEKTPASPPAAASRNDKSQIQTNYAAAVREAQLKNRPLLVLLGAQWCSWCRKLEAELETPEAQPILNEWIVAEVDVDNEPEVAARLEASALPGLRILGPFQTVVASREGYLEIPELKQWLDENRKSADPAVFKVLYDTTEPSNEALNQLIKLLADSSPMVRGAAVERLAAHSRVAAGPLVQILKTGRLAQQLSACEVLRRWHAPVEKIDPWQPDTIRTEQFATLIEWARQRIETGGSPTDPNSKTTTAPTFDAQSANDLLQRLMKTDPAQRSALISQLLGLGQPLATEIRSRLARGDNLDDSSRERLRELLYNLLASRKLRFEQTGVLAALGRLDLDSHRQAAATILDQASLIDQPLADELARDSDPLVRELAVRAFGRLGLMGDKNRVQQLLADSNSNVRTAVLRVLTEHPSDESLEIVCDYLGKEKDEDLLVHGAKCLAQLSRQEKALAALARLAANPSWRVRATAIEVTGTAIQNRPQQVVYSANGTMKSGVPRELADAILAAAFEKDAFVAERAAKTLPTIIQQGGLDETTLESITAGLADHPDQFRMILEKIQNGAESIHHTANSESVFPPVVRVAKAWLTRGDPKEVQRAAVLLSRLAPGELDNRMGELIASSHRTVRLAGLRAAANSIEKYRTKSIESAVDRSTSRIGTPDSLRQLEPTPWYELPKDEDVQAGEVQPGTPPIVQQPAQQIVEQGKVGEKPATTPAANPAQTSALDVVSQLFGGAPATSPPPPSAAQLGGSAPAGSKVAGPNTATPNDDEVELPSKWMSNWQRGNVQDRPKWLRDCEASTEKLLASSDPVEHTWALAVWLMLGHIERTDELLKAMAEPVANKDVQKEFVRFDYLSWLPADKRLVECKRRLSEIDKEHDKVSDTLRQCTTIDDPQLADWLVDHLNDGSLADPKNRALVARALLRSHVGGFTDGRFLTMLAAESYEYSQKAPYRIVGPKQTLAIPGGIAACEWLRQRYQKATTDSQRAIGLLAVAQLDHRTAVNAAIGAIQAADKDGEAVQVALSIVFNDAPVASVQRATLLLSHKLPAVQSAALQYLALPGVAIQAEKRVLAAVVNNQSPLPGLWRATEKFPVDKLRGLSTTGTAIQKSQAKLLLAATGEQVELNQLEHALPAKQNVYTKLCIAAALAKAGRNDQNAVEHYRATYAEAAPESRPQDGQIIAALYETLRDLSGDEIAELRRRMRNEKGPKLFNNNSSNDNLFGKSQIHFTIQSSEIHVSQ